MVSAGKQLRVCLHRIIVIWSLETVLGIILEPIVIWSLEAVLGIILEPIVIWSLETVLEVILEPIVLEPIVLERIKSGAADLSLDACRQYK